MSDRSSYRNDGSDGAASVGMSLTGFLVGAAVGAGLALLLAPGPGTETRRKLGEAARRLGDAAGDAVRHGREGGSGDKPVSSGDRPLREPLSRGRPRQTGTEGPAS